MNENDRFAYIKQKKYQKGINNLLKHKKYDDISVKDICEVAGISQALSFTLQRQVWFVEQYQFEITKEGSKKFKVYYKVNVICWLSYN